MVNLNRKRVLQIHRNWLISFGIYLGILLAIILSAYRGVIPVEINAFPVIFLR